MCKAAAGESGTVSWSPFRASDSTTYPAVGDIVLGQLRHCTTKGLGEALLVRVAEDDVFWRTADDESEVSYDWDVVAYRAPDLHLLAQAPITAGQRRWFARNVTKLQDLLDARGERITRADLARATAAAHEHFELGCWLYFYSRFIHHPGAKAARIDCLRRLLATGFTNLDRQFLVAFDIGRRQFDSLLQSDDAMEVMSGVRQFIPADTSSNIARAITELGWPVCPD